MARGIVIQIQGDGEGARRALEMVREQMEETAAAGERATGTYGRFGSAVEGGVPRMAAASAALRALEGGFTNNIRAGERFLSMLPGVSSLLETAFPAIGATVLATALVSVGEKAYEAIQNVVELKSALEGLGQVDLTVSKRLESNADAIERNMEGKIEATQGHVASLKQKLAYESGKPLDLSELFYDKNFSGLSDRVKTTYESMYKSVAPQDVPEKLGRIRTEVANLNGALQTVRDGSMGAFVPKVGGFGPSMFEDPKKYYESRIQAATDVEKLLSSEVAKRQSSLALILAEMNKPAKEGRERTPRTPSDNSFLTSEAALADAQSRAQADALKVFDQQRLAELETQHKLLLVSDQEYYAEKLNLQNEMLDAEESALKGKQADLEKLLSQQQGDKTLRRGADGRSAEEVRTQTQLVDLARQLNELTARRGQYASENTAEVALATQNAELNNLRAAAELERQRGDSIQAQIQLMRQELDLELRRMQAQGASADAIANTKALEQRQEQMLEIAQVQREMDAIETSAATKRSEIDDRVNKGVESKKAAEQELNQLREQELAQLVDLAQQYETLAAALGGPYVQAAEKLRAQLTNLAIPDQKQGNVFGQQLAKGVTSLADTIAEQTLRGKTSFKDMVREVEADLAKLALQLLETKLMPGGSGSGAVTGSGGGFGAGLSDFFTKIFGAAGEHHMSGGIGSDSPQVVGEAGPEVWTPPTRGGSYTPNNVLTKIAESGGGGGAPNVTTNVVNQTSNPVQAQPSQVSWNSQLREFVIHTVLEDSAQGGMLSHLNPNAG